MDLVAGKNIFIVTATTKGGAPKLVRRCTYPLTGLRVVQRIYTNLAVIAVTPKGFKLLETGPNVNEQEVRNKTDAEFVDD